MREQLEAQLRDIYRLQGTLQHYRSWAAQLQARYQVFNPDAARPAKRVYIGNLPAAISEAELRQAVNELMVQIGGTAMPGFPITSVKLYSGTGEWPGAVPPPQVQDRSYAFIEFRSVEEASNAMALDGVLFRDNYIKIRRPNNYDANLAIMLGPTEPSPVLDLSGLEIVRTVVADSPHKLFVGGLPCDWTEDQVKEMLVPFGPLKAFNLVMDRATGNSKGYAFCEYADVSVTDVVISQLNGKAIGNKFLTVKRALAPAHLAPSHMTAGMGGPTSAHVLPPGAAAAAGNGVGPGVGGPGATHPGLGMQPMHAAMMVNHVNHHAVNGIF